MYLSKFGASLTSEFTVVRMDFSDLCGGYFVEILRLRNEGYLQKGFRRSSKCLSELDMSEKIEFKWI